MTTPQPLRTFSTPPYFDTWLRWEYRPTSTAREPLAAAAKELLRTAGRRRLKTPEVAVTLLRDLPSTPALRAAAEALMTRYASDLRDIRAAAEAAR